ncbi:killer cell lectin-like receptor [Cricetulus griseus]|uniref:Killer cell lectin-like receptor n=2 Tax=Cricetulus griseus TaxID=10029 RepID=A0A061HZZ9_CRIGR|nr:killer cell lectin-like receptor [Cricetulus griseus]
MSDEEITYATLRFHKSSSGLQDGGRPDETQVPSEASHRECSVPWYLIAIPLGILCSILLVTVAVLVKHIFQYSQEKHELQKTLNDLHQEYSTMQNDSYLREEMLRNKSIEFEALREHLDSLNRKQNRCRGETKVVLDCKQRTGKHVEARWFCCGIKCYYFIMDGKQWTGCKQTCQNCSLSLLKIEDDDELKFLQPKINPHSFWIGLSYVTKKRKWQWINNSPPKLDLMTMESLKEGGNCAFLSLRGIQPDDCGRTHPCICEKRMNKIRDSVCSMKKKTQSAKQTE